MPTWSDNPATRDTPIRYGHINELREWVERRRSAYSAPTGGWQPPAWSNGARLDSSDPIRAVHFTELRTAIQQLWDKTGLGAIGPWTRRVGGAPSGGGTIFASDINDLRGWFDTYENSLAVQGADSFSYNPQETGEPIIQPSWAQNVRDLLPGKPFLVRCNMLGRRYGPNDVRITDSDPESDLQKFKRAFGYYQDHADPNQRVQVFALFGLESYETPAGQPADPLTAPPGFSNTYIEGFSDQVSAVSRILFNDVDPDRGVRDIMIWNEPNAPGNQTLDAAHFAALLRRCYQKTRVPIRRLYWGGVDFNTGVGGLPDPANIGYVRGVYQALANNGLAPPAEPWPWQGINIHVRHDRTAAFYVSLFDQIDGIRSGRGDSGELVVGEWGITFADDASRPEAMQNSWDGIKPRADKMSYFAHQYVDETPNLWGLQYYGPTGGGQYVVTGNTGLYDPYTATVRS